MSTSQQQVTSETSEHLRRVLLWVVAGAAAAVILIEIALTRLFSVLLYYHHSFLAVALALFGLAAGGVSASRERLEDSGRLLLQLRALLRRASTALLGLLLLLVLTSPANESVPLSLAAAFASAVPLFLLGKALALAMARGRRWIHRLYAVDLVTSAAAALLAIPLLALVQGPLVLAIPALLGIALDTLLAAPGRRLVPAACTFLLASVIAFAATQDGPLLPLRDPWQGRYILERWNAHSRVRVSDWAPGRRMLVIDKTAASLIPHVPASGTASIPRPTSSDWQYDPSYLLGRSVRRVAIIGVGGGPDILPALDAGATRVDGFELNSRIIELLRDGLGGYVTLAHRPEVHLIHDEARHALQHQVHQYDVIRANLTDTWAATAAGGFVLAENGLYTVEAWRLFLARLTSSGVLVTTRWYLPAAPAEAERLVALAAEVLHDEDLAADQHLVALTLPTQLEDPVAGGMVHTITTLLSRQPFTSTEVSGLRAFAVGLGGALLVWPGQAHDSASPWTSILTASSRRVHIGTSNWDIDPPTDERPFFFLQLRPADVLRFWTADFGYISAITVNGVRVLMTTVILAVFAAIVLSALAIKGGGRLGAPLPVGGKVYFALLGLGYMAVQLALLQRLSLILGHPVSTLALVIACMLAGTGVGSALGGLGRMPHLSTLLTVPPIFIGALTVGFGHLGTLSQLPSLHAAAVACGGIAGMSGVALGLAFPTGVRAFARSDAAVTEAWALNGAFSVLGSAAAALGGLLLGSRGLIALAVPCYTLAWVIIRRSPRPAG